MKLYLFEGKKKKKHVRTHIRTYVCMYLRLQHYILALHGAGTKSYLIFLFGIMWRRRQKFLGHSCV